MRQMHEVRVRVQGQAEDRLAGPVQTTASVRRGARLLLAVSHRRPGARATLLRVVPRRAARAGRCEAGVVTKRGFEGHFDVPALRVPRRARPDNESQIVADIRAAFARIDGVTCWRNNVGLLPNPATGVKTAFGLCLGSSDLIGILGPRARFFALECKKPGEKPTAKQFAFIALVNKRGGLATWVDNVDDAVIWIGWALAESQ
jgi:hypothetical protein